MPQINRFNAKLKMQHPSDSYKAFACLSIWVWIHVPFWHKVLHISLREFTAFDNRWNRLLGVLTRWSLIIEIQNVGYKKMVRLLLWCAWCQHFPLSDHCLLTKCMHVSDVSVKTTLHCTNVTSHLHFSLFSELFYSLFPVLPLILGH